MPIECLSAGILVADHLCDPIAQVPGPGEVVLCDRLPLSIGGCASNVAVDLARLGVPVGVVGCVGRDPFGRFVLDTLSAAQIDVSHVRQLDGVDTSCTMVINVQGQDRRFIHAPGASDHFKAAFIPLDRVLAAKVFYLGGYLLMANLEPDRLAELFRRARAAGVKTVLDVVLPGPDDHWSKLAPVLAETDVFLPNQSEAESITGLADPVQQAERFLNAGARTVVITCGGDGSVLISDRLRVKASTYPVQYQGGTGSGDAFDAGYIAGMLSGEDAIGCLRWGSAIGASCVRSVSATQSVFTRPEALAFMRDETLRIEKIA